ncbi:hydantoinase/oxoprolinase family protein [Cocleimonas sp. KMM 6892]|uniref:hydantoinase/oxoprolinase family protein n=1 Tax=unclassified Cocleimonas TaxID=2639732 RepID=UPI002DB5EE93|nr:MULTISPECIES: hydantoinase/oxoprolinase family protein [unclassified Cocleimonas]MEB8431931.1 hydantoinase/oxoprolinase family protein [Cocleimonas sp. KMM 6892]MEC4714983.1 hydantoinase/oxoprolinase family protein [Cocleimonas sp. KMM 6895]MEC4744203.1 hydantoinase/oxoprolinase family protein [Cocleimonas sp. KMM 6896]
MNEHFTIGIDTGGTYTDAVVVDTAKREILASAKSLTTHGNLSLGVIDALQQALGAADIRTQKEKNRKFDVSEIALVSLSTTLATNALVEGQGSSLVVFLLGFNDAMVERTEIAKAIPDAKIIRIDGGHVYTGKEQQALDTDTIREALASDKGKADAYAVAGHYSVRNQAHEREAAELIKSITGAPVTASCDLSDSLNGPKRALTAGFNAQIVSLIVQLESAVREALHTLGIDAPIMIVKGDGSIARADSVMYTPIETILSGPAASVIGARYLTGEKDFLISDMGGTTTDVATVVDGWPALNEAGADVGGYRTLVKAIDMKTLGLGGDSEVEIDGLQHIQLLPNRALPLSMLAMRFPHIEEELAAALTANSGMHSALQYLLLQSSIESSDFSEREQELLSVLSTEKPILFREAIVSAKDRSTLKRLISRGVVRMSGFTPSDAAHVLGLQSQWNTKAAFSACELLGRATGYVSNNNTAEKIQALAQKIHDAVVTKSTRLMIDQLAAQSFSENDVLVNAVASGNPLIKDLNITFESRIPLVAVGGPAEIFYPNVGERLGQPVLIPTYSAVANAIGAAVGHVKSSCIIEVTLHEKQGFQIHAPDEVIHVESATRALDIAKDMAITAVSHDLITKGGEVQNKEDITVNIDRIEIPGMEGDAGLISAKITAECESHAS